MNKKKYYIDDNVKIPKEIQNLAPKELNEEIKKMEKQLQERKKQNTL
ncbi:MAG: hypothetical protein HFK00_08510 [Oscillospiraceae bacterium]|nr:hypothetical protein [Oscillospiraceae bacterium]